MLRRAREVDEVIHVKISVRRPSEDRIDDAKDYIKSYYADAAKQAPKAEAWDAAKEADSWRCYTHGGSEPTDLEAVAWARECRERGAGEILLTSMDHDGTKDGFAIELTRYMATSLGIPVIASGGAGTMQHFLEVFDQAQCSAALAASVFHFGTIQIPDLKRYLKSKHISIRI